MHDQTASEKYDHMIYSMPKLRQALFDAWEPHPGARGCSEGTSLHISRFRLAWRSSLLPGYADDAFVPDTGASPRPELPCPDDYRDCLDYLYGRLNYEWLGMPRSSGQLRLGRMRRLLRRMGDPHLGLRIIHVAGTKGKGSTSAMIAARLSASGVARAVLFAAPRHLEERFHGRPKPASASELIDLVDVAREPLSSSSGKTAPAGRPRTDVL